MQSGDVSNGKPSWCMPEFRADSSVGSRKQQKSILPGDLNYNWLVFFFNVLEKTEFLKLIHRYFEISVQLSRTLSVILICLLVFPFYSYLNFYINLHFSHKLPFFLKQSKLISICLLVKIFVYQFPNLVNFETRRIKEHAFLFLHW